MERSRYNALYSSGPKAPSVFSTKSHTIRAEDWAALHFACARLTPPAQGFHTTLSARTVRRPVISGVTNGNVGGSPEILPPVDRSPSGDQHRQEREARAGHPTVPRSPAPWSARLSGNGDRLPACACAGSLILGRCWLPGARCPSRLPATTAPFPSRSIGPVVLAGAPTESEEALHVAEDHPSIPRPSPPLGPPLP